MPHTVKIKLLFGRLSSELIVLSCSMYLPLPEFYGTSSVLPSKGVSFYFSEHVSSKFSEKVNDHRYESASQHSSVISLRYKPSYLYST